MAIVNSHTQFKSKGSLGATYYAQRYGRTIQAQKPGPRSNAMTRGDSAGSARESFFGLVSQYMSAHADDIKASFNRVKFGSARNYFFKVNKDALREALTPLLLMSPTIEQIDGAIETYAKSKPTSLYRVKKSGFNILYLSGKWDSSDNPMTIESSLATILKVGAYAVANKTVQLPNIEGAESYGLVGSRLDLITVESNCEATLENGMLNIPEGAKTGKNITLSEGTNVLCEITFGVSDGSAA